VTWEEELAAITVAANNFGVDALFVATIRKVENGSTNDPDAEFGVLKLRGKGYAAQLKATCETVRHRLMVYTQNPFNLWPTANASMRLGYTRQWIREFAAAWAPIGVQNDPSGMNSAWPDNALAVYAKLISEVEP